ncbi:MAG: hypothetical protein M0Q91_12245 [Methanoregula sp.]|jgi:hypothetical protein|nr:hypothetical protein [Methanoregula sp.]
MKQMMISNKCHDMVPVFPPAGINMLPVLSPQNTFTRDRSSQRSDSRNANTTRSLMTERLEPGDLKWYLMNKYRALFVDKLTGEDLEELRYYLRRQYDPKRGGDQKYVWKFVLKLQEYMHEDILKCEIAGIVSLVTLMKPEDLNNGAK